MSAETLVAQPPPLNRLGTQGNLYSIPPPHTTTSVTARTALDCGKKAPMRTLSPFTRLAFAPPDDDAMAAPAISVSAARLRRLAFATLIVAAPFLLVVRILRGSF